jgi:hypothetical protein
VERRRGMSFWPMLPEAEVMRMLRDGVDMMMVGWIKVRSENLGCVKTMVLLSGGQSYIYFALEIFAEYRTQRSRNGLSVEALE